MRHESAVDTCFGTLINTIRLTFAVWSTTVNLLDRWAPLRACTLISRELMRIP